MGWCQRPDTILAGNERTARKGQGMKVRGMVALVLAVGLSLSCGDRSNAQSRYTQYCERGEWKSGDQLMGAFNFGVHMLTLLVDYAEAVDGLPIEDQRTFREAYNVLAVGIQGRVAEMNALAQYIARSEDEDRAGTAIEIAYRNSSLPRPSRVDLILIASDCVNYFGLHGEDR